MSNILKLQLTPGIVTGLSKCIKQCFGVWQIGDLLHIKTILKD